MLPKIYIEGPPKASWRMVGPMISIAKVKKENWPDKGLRQNGKKNRLVNKIDDEDL